MSTKAKIICAILQAFESTNATPGSLPGRVTPPKTPKEIVAARKTAACEKRRRKAERRLNEQLKKSERKRLLES